MIKGNVELDHIEGTSNSFIVTTGFGYEDDEYVVDVHPGWRTDGASVPKILWNIFPPISGKYMEASVLHDALYGSHIFTKDESDLIFLRAMEDLNVSTWKRYTMYYAVKFFGYSAWNEKTPEYIKKMRRFVKGKRK